MGTQTKEIFEQLAEKDPAFEEDAQTDFFIDRPVYFK